MVWTICLSIVYKWWAFVASGAEPCCSSSNARRCGTYLRLMRPSAWIQFEMTLSYCNVPEGSAQTGNEYITGQPHLYIQCVRKVAVQLYKVLAAMSTSVYTGLNMFNFIRKHIQQICIWKVAVHLQKVLAVMSTGQQFAVYIPQPTFLCAQWLSEHTLQASPYEIQTPNAPWPDRPQNVRRAAGSLLSILPQRTCHCAFISATKSVTHLPKTLFRFCWFKIARTSNFKSGQ
jgi:hypothetical protein